MRLVNISACLVASTLLLTQAYLLPSTSKNSRLAPPSDRIHQQQVMDSGPGIQLPSTEPPASSSPNSDVIISDVISNTKMINIFAGFSRDVDAIARRLDTSSANTTVLAPMNSAITSLPRKPWEDPRDYSELGANAYGGKAGEDRAHANLRRFVEAHIVPVSPWKEGEKVQSLAGGNVWWEKKGDKAVVMPGEVEVDRVVNRVANGEVWILKGVLNYA